LTGKFVNHLNIILNLLNHLKGGESFMNVKKEGNQKVENQENVIIEKERKIAPENLRSKAGFAKTHGRPASDLPTTGF